MATLADSLKSSSSRPLALRARTDLTCERQQYQGRSYWVVKEPLGLKYFRFQEEEFSILKMLDGEVSLDEIKARFEKQFAPQKMTLPDLQQFVGTLHRNSLVVSESSGQGNQLHKRRSERRRKEWKAAATNLLAIRFKGVDPERFLHMLAPYTSWMFSRLAILCGCLLALAAGSLVLIQFATFQSRLPAFQEFFGPSNWLLLGLVLAVTKILHELGHGLACKRYGGECHQIGLMLLVFTPCLYCDVSDSWMLQSKWKRAAVGAAGMYVEIVLGSLATLIWWFSEPGTLNHLALRVMFICSVSTLLFNGNPLLRYDGYYILSDLVEIPNLRQQASSAFNRTLAKWCLGMDLPKAPFQPERNQGFFTLYAIASVIYRWVVLFSILFFLCKVLEPYGLEVLGQSLAVFSVVSMTGRPLWQLIKFLRSPGRMEQVKRPQLRRTLVVAVVVLLVVLLIPLPRRVFCSVEIKPRDAVSVYVDVVGRLDKVFVRPGQEVSPGDQLAQLTNVDLQLEAAELRGQRDEYQTQLKNLSRIRLRNQQGGEEIEQTRQTLLAIEQQLQEKTSDLARLDIRSKSTGTVLPPARRDKPAAEEKFLRGWIGSPFDSKNIGARLEESELFCQIGDPQRLEAVLIVDQSDVVLVRRQQEVAVKLYGFSGQTFFGSIDEIAESRLEVAPNSLSNQAGGELATRTDQTGAARPMSTSYTARVPLNDPAGKIRLGMRGKAKIYTGWQPLGGRIWRYLSHTFHFRL